MRNKYKMFKNVCCMGLIAAVMAVIPSCASRVTNIEGPAAAVFHTSEDYLYIADESVPLAAMDGEDDALRILALEVFDLCNQEREAKGLEKFKWNEELYIAAMERANELNEDFSHTRPDGSEFYSAAQEAGIPEGAISENIAIGHKTAKKLLQTWMRFNSSKETILGDYEYIGIGVSECSEESSYTGYAFTQLVYNP